MPKRAIERLALSRLVNAYRAVASDRLSPILLIGALTSRAHPLHEVGHQRRREAASCSSFEFPV